MLTLNPKFVLHFKGFDSKPLSSIGSGLPSFPYRVVVRDRRSVVMVGSSVNVILASPSGLGSTCLTRLALPCIPTLSVGLAIV